MSYLDESDEIAPGVTVRIAADGDGFKIYDHHSAWVRLDAEVSEDQSWSENVERIADEDAAWKRYEERAGDGFAAMVFEIAGVDGDARHTTTPTPGGKDAR